MANYNAFLFFFFFLIFVISSISLVLSQFRVSVTHVVSICKPVIYAVQVLLGMLCSYSSFSFSWRERDLTSGVVAVL